MLETMHDGKNSEVTQVVVGTSHSSIDGAHTRRIDNIVRLGATQPHPLFLPSISDPHLQRAKPSHKHSLNKSQRDNQRRRIRINSFSDHRREGRDVRVEYLCTQWSVRAVVSTSAPAQSEEGEDVAD